MHPREGWTEDRRPYGLSRRGFLKQGAAAGLLLGGASSLLEACGSSGTTGTAASSSSGGIPLPRPNSPVTWPLFKDNPAIKSGLAPERDATLRLFNWVAYINPQCLKDFGKKYNCKVEVTTFENMDVALAKLRSGQHLGFDVFFPTVDVMAQLVVREADPAAQPQLHPEHHAGLVGLHQPVLRRQVAVHGALHHLHDRHRLA